MAAARAATGTALEMIGRGEDHDGSFEVIVLGIERGQGIRGKWAIFVHGTIVADAGLYRAEVRIET
jgi:hypothetical protein